MKRKNMIKHTIIGTLVMFAGLLMFCENAYAISKENLNISNGDVKCTDSNVEYHVSGTSSSNNITVDGKNIKLYLDNVKIDMLDEEDDGDSVEKPAIDIKGGSSVTIYFSGSNHVYGGNETGLFEKNSGYAGIQVAEDASVSLQGLNGGYLYAKGGGISYGAAGIGSEYNENCGSISISKEMSDNFTIVADGGDGGAGIGSGENGDCVKGINIDGGNIEAYGQEGGAGIGGGHAAILWAEGHTDNINIRGGNIKAEGLHTRGGLNAANVSQGGGAGIGSGGHGHLEGIIIEGNPVIDANAEFYAAGIGGGSFDGWDCTIRIKGGKVTACGHGGAGIGSGAYQNAGTISISGETDKDSHGNWKSYVEAEGYWGGAGIGAGTSGDLVHIDGSGMDVALIEIKGNYVDAQSSDSVNDDTSGSAIGGSEGPKKSGIVKRFKITGGIVKATAGESCIYDIGSADANNKVCGEFIAEGGTLLGRVSEFESYIINNASVQGEINGAKNSAGKNVYRTQFNFVAEDADSKKLDPARVSRIAMDADKIVSLNNVYADSSDNVYLYLPEKEEQIVDIYSYKDRFRYVGTTNTENTGYLNRQDTFIVEYLEEPIVGKEFKVKISSPINMPFTVTPYNNSVILLNENGEEISSINSSDGGAVEVDLKIICDLDYFSKWPSFIEYEKYFKDYFGRFSIKIEQTGENVKNPYEIIHSDRADLYYTEIKIVGDISKTYDGEPIENPYVRTPDSKIDVEYTYYQGTEVSEEFKLPGAPLDVGTYTVVATSKETQASYYPSRNSYRYAAAVSDPVQFKIEPKDVVMEMSATQDDVSATVTVEVSGLVRKDTSEYGTVILKENGIQIGEPIPVVLKREKYVAIYTQSSVLAGDHTITAVYQNDSGNYSICEPIERTFNKMLVERTISAQLIVNEEPLDALTYGYSNGYLVVRDDQGIIQNPNDLDYEIIGASDVVTISRADQERERVKIQNAGDVIIKITLPGDGAYADAVTFVNLKVQPKPVNIESYAYIADDEAKTPVTSVTYGTELSYELATSVNSNDIEKYKNGKVELYVTGPDCAADVGTYLLSIEKVVGEDRDETAMASLLRNYSISFKESSVKIVPAQLTIRAKNTTVSYGSEEPTYEYILDGLKEWDEEEDLFREQKPIVLLDQNKTDGKVFEELTPGVYEDALYVANAGSSKNYVTSADESRADLIIEKQSVSIEVEDLSKDYDGMPIDIEDSVTFENSIEYDGTLEYCFYKIENGEWIKLDNSPVNAGLYAVNITGTGSKLYEINETSVVYTINKLIPNVDNPVGETVPMEEGLTLADIQLPNGWEWENPETLLEIGIINAIAVYTPEDTMNYEMITLYVPVEVVSGDSAIIGGTIGSSKDEESDIDVNISDNENTNIKENNKNTVDTGDSGIPLSILWSFAGSLVAILGILILRKKR